MAGMVMSPEAEISGQANLDTALELAKISVQTEKRPLRCFLCVGNPALPKRDRIKKYATVGSLSRHFRTHVVKLEKGKIIDCPICDVKGMDQKYLQNHAELCHGTVTRVDPQPTKQTSGVG